MTIIKLLQIVSLVFLIYLAYVISMNIDITPTKTQYLITSQKLEVDSIQDMRILKQKTKDYIDIIHRIHNIHSKKSHTNFWILVGLIFIQVFLILYSPIKIRQNQNIK